MKSPIFRSQIKRTVCAFSTEWPTNAEKMKNYGMTSQLIEQAAKEMGDAYTNRQKIEHSSLMAA